MEFGRMSARVESLRDRILEFKPETCIERAIIVTDLYKKGEIYKQPMVVQRAMVLDEILRKMKVIINDGELIVGNRGTNLRPGVIFPEMSVDWIERELDTFETRDIDKFITPEPLKKTLREDILPFWNGKTVDERALAQMPEETRNFMKTGIFSTGRLKNSMGHILPGYETVLKYGFSGIRERAEKELEEIDFTIGENIEKANFLRAVIICCNAAITFGRRFAEKATELSKDETDLVRKKELENIAKVCSRIPEFPAESFWEALQTFWFTHVIIHIETDGVAISPGRFDQYMYPYYAADLKAGKIDEQSAQELIECLWVKFSEILELWDEPFCRYNTAFPVAQNLILGGVTSDGSDATNDLTYMCLKATARVKLTQPNLAMRVHRNTPKDLLMTACEVIKTGVGMPQLFSDEVIIPSLMSRKVSLLDARNYAIVGCVEPSIPAKTMGMTNAGFFNLAKLLEFALNDGICRLTGKRLSISTGDPRKFECFEDLMVAYKKQMEYMVKQMVIALQAIELAHREMMPTPFLSCTIDDCISRGKDVIEGGAIYNYTGPQGLGTGTVADSLAAVKKLVFEEKVISMDKLLEVLDKNFEGYETVRYMLMNKAPKYGNDDDYVDLLAKRALNIYCDEVDKYTNPRGGIFQPGAYSVSGNVPHGLMVGATPDGRMSREVISDGVSPSPGRDRKGPVAVVKSVSKIDHIRATNGTLLNQKFHPMVLSDQKGMQSFEDLIRTYLVDLGGMHVQYNVVSAETLRKAQCEPEKYRSLIVRVAGYSAFFVELSPQLQQHVIERTEFQSF